MSILDHVWGVSPGQDRVWAMVNGLRPGIAGERALMVLQAYVDESEGVDGTLVLGGCISTAEKWAAFAAEWEALLPYAVLGKSGYHFKMSEMAINDERMSRVPAFFHVFNKYVQTAFSISLNINDLTRVKNRIYIPNYTIDYKKAQPYYLLFSELLAVFAKRRNELSQVINFVGKLDFIFDNKTEKSPIISTWDERISMLDEGAKEYYSNTPRFEDDREFLPLQAADLWAWWARKAMQDNDIEVLRTGRVGNWKELPRFGRVVMPFTEDTLTKTLMKTVRRQTRRDGKMPTVIYDIKIEL